jgi:hypothetical protein
VEAWSTIRITDFPVSRIDGSLSFGAAGLDDDPRVLAMPSAESDGRAERLYQDYSKQWSTADWVVGYRYAAEATGRCDMERASKLVDSLRGELPAWANRVLRFNLGITALNQGRMGVFEKIEREFAMDSSVLGQFFWHWLRGGYHQLQEQSAESVKQFLMAIDVSEELPSRASDRPILAHLALHQSLWAGNLEASRQCWKIIEKSMSAKQVLSLQSHSLGKAIYELSEGRLQESLLRFEALFEYRPWTQDHLRAGEIYFWVLIARREGPRGSRLVQWLQEVQQALGFVEERSLLPLFALVFAYLKEEMTLIDLQKKLLRWIDLFQVRQISNGVLIGKLLFHLLDDDAETRLEAFQLVSSNPFLQRLSLAILSEHRVSVSGLRRLQSQVSDEIAQLMLELQLSRATEDLQLFVQTLRRLSQKRALAWAGLLSHDQGSNLSLEFGKTLLSKELVVDLESHRVMAVESLETLDGQPLLAELAVSLFLHPKGLNKEQAALGIGYTPYDPLQHDPIIYNLISRLRDWLRKQGLRVSIGLGRSGWYWTQRDLVQGRLLTEDESKPCLFDGTLQNLKFENQGLPSGWKSSLAFGEMNPRWDWIMTMVEKKSFVSRAELMARFPIKKSTAANDFNRLIELGFIERQGQGRGIYYTLKEKTR